MTQIKEVADQSARLQLAVRVIQHLREPGNVRQKAEEIMGHLLGSVGRHCIQLVLTGRHFDTAVPLKARQTAVGVVQTDRRIALVLNSSKILNSHGS